MVIGSIAYVNLLPFHLFMKRTLHHNGAKMAFRYKQAIPSHINQAMRRHQIDAAFISSIESRRYRCSDAAIIAKGAVYSVLVIPHEKGNDPASATSNALKDVLGLQGRVLIGDAALRYYLEGKEAIDLAYEWHQKTNLPFVFARLCCTKQSQYINHLAKRFVATPIKIPGYILRKEARKCHITPKQLRWYLKQIHYHMDTKAHKGLKIFLRYAKKKQI